MLFLINVKIARIANWFQSLLYITHTHTHTRRRTLVLLLSLLLTLRKLIVDFYGTYKKKCLTCSIIWMILTPIFCVLSFCFGWPHHTIVNNERRKCKFNCQINWPQPLGQSLIFNWYRQINVPQPILTQLISHNITCFGTGTSL